MIETWILLYPDPAILGWETVLRVRPAEAGQPLEVTALIGQPEDLAKVSATDPESAFRDAPPSIMAVRISARGRWVNGLWLRGFETVGPGRLLDRSGGWHEVGLSDWAPGGKELPRDSRLILPLDKGALAALVTSVEQLPVDVRHATIESMRDGPMGLRARWWHLASEAAAERAESAAAARSAASGSAPPETPPGAVERVVTKLLDLSQSVVLSLIVGLLLLLAGCAGGTWILADWWGGGPAASYQQPDAPLDAGRSADRSAPRSRQDYRAVPDPVPPGRVEVPQTAGRRLLLPPEDGPAPEPRVPVFQSVTTPGVSHGAGGSGAFSWTVHDSLVRDDLVCRLSQATGPGATYACPRPTSGEVYFESPKVPCPPRMG